MMGHLTDKAVVVKNGAKKCYIFSTFLQLHLE